MNATVPAVYGAIAKVSAELAKEGIAKGRKNQQQGYTFRGIDDVLNALAPILVTHGLVILPRCLSRTSTERETKTGGVLFYAVVEAAFDFVAIADGSTHTVTTFGEAMDSADKATNKAMSAAYKYAAILAFCIPVVGEDADETTHEPTPQQSRAPVTSPDKPRAVAGESHAAPEGDGVVRVTGIKKAKSGINDKGEWTLWILSFSDGREFKTFDDGLAARVQIARKNNQALRLAVTGDKLTNVHEAA